ncbi:MAG: phosphopyruvate hydratase [Candidatus Pacebacteria bacterium]|nr:phosphopyruvate hydratase [Candidatus Paceibacterota bacterium]
MSKIKSVRAREILDSRGEPTVEVILDTEIGIFVDSVPSGASTGSREAVEIRDGDESRYLGKGVLKAISNVRINISNKIEGYRVNNQKEVDEAMISLDKSENKAKIGANSTMGVSLAVARAGAKFNKQELFAYISSLSNNEIKLPSPCFNVINGGKHAGNGLAFQEFMINFEGRKFKDQVRMASEVYHTLKEIIVDKYGVGAINVGDEGGFAPQISDPKEALNLIIKAVKKLDYLKDLNIFLDIAASEFYDAKNGKYILNKETSLDREELIKYYQELCLKYPIKSLEDPFEENDYEGFRMLNQKMLGNLLIIGDDLTVTNVKGIEKAYEKDAINGLLVKINQVGTVSEAIEAVNLAKLYGYKIMVSHRSGETTDDFIADFAVGLGADYIKAGAPARGERVAKYNRLLKIEDILKL